MDKGGRFAESILKKVIFINYVLNFLVNKRKYKYHIINILNDNKRQQPLLSEYKYL